MERWSDAAMERCSDGAMERCSDGAMANARMGECLYGRMLVWANARMGECSYGDEWMNERMDGWIGQWMDQWEDFFCMDSAASALSGVFEVDISIRGQDFNCLEMHFGLRRSASTCMYI